MCDFGISAAAIAAGISTSISTAASAVGAAAAATGAAVGSAASATGAFLGIGAATTFGGGSAVLGAGAGAITDAALLATAAGGAAQGLTLAEGLGIASLVGSLGAGGGSAGASAKQAKDQAALSKGKAKQETKNTVIQAGQEAEANAQKNFQLAQAALAARGEVNAANLGDRSVRAIGRAVGFQLGTDKATVKRNQEVANQVATARLRGIELTRASDKIQIGDPATIAGTGAASTIAGSLSAGAGAYSAFSKFEVPLKTSI